jgi:hypothetical protein
LNHNNMACGYVSHGAVYLRNSWLDFVLTKNSFQTS